MVSIHQAYLELLHNLPKINSAKNYETLGSLTNPLNGYFYCCEVFVPTENIT
jgi:hypothetical protein